MIFKPVIGQQCLFAYPEHYTLYVEHRAHSGQVVTVLSELETDLGEEPCYLVVATDGWKGDVFLSELSPV